MTYSSYKLSSRERNFIIAGFIALVVIIVFFTQVVNKKLVPPQTTIIINGQKITAELATTPSQRYQGLSGRQKICETCGLLFVFNTREVQTFVMRDMLFPLDIVFINDNKVVKIDPILLPEGANPQALYSSEVPVNYVLELNSGFTDKYNINIGDTVEYNF